MSSLPSTTSIEDTVVRIVNAVTSIRSQDDSMDIMLVINRGRGDGVDITEPKVICHGPTLLGQNERIRGAALERQGIGSSPTMFRRLITNCAGVNSELGSVWVWYNCLPFSLRLLMGAKYASLKGGQTPDALLKFVRSSLGEHLDIQYDVPVSALRKPAPGVLVPSRQRKRAQRVRSLRPTTSMRRLDMPTDVHSVLFLGTSTGGQGGGGIML